MSTFTMPSLGADMEEGKLVEWLVKPGDKVGRGDIVAVVETQKGAIEIEIFDEGEVTALLAQPGQTLPVGAPLAQIGADEGAGREAAPAAAKKPEPVPAKAVLPAPVATKPSPAPAPAGHGRPAQPSVSAKASAHGSAHGSAAGGAVAASPAARALAAERGISLDAVVGSGPGGAILLLDVERHLAVAAAPGGNAAEAERRTGKPGLDMAEMRRAIAAAMSRSKREIPHYYLSHEIDLQPAQDWLSARNADRPPDRRLLMGAVLVRATVRALAKVPELNGRFETEPYTPSAKVHCGLAVALRGGGLIAPAILDAQDMDIDAIMEAMRDVIARSRSGRLRNSEITQGTITISSLGETGVDALFGVIYPPQVALVGFGAPRRRPMLRGDSVEPRLSVTVSLAADHRVSDGRRGALFLAEIAHQLQEPDRP